MVRNCGKMLRMVASAIILVGAFVPVRGSAQEGKFWIDHMLDYCNTVRREGENAVLVYSAFQIAVCEHGKSKLDSLTKKAMRQCNKQKPAGLKRQGECQVIMSNSEIVNPGVVGQLRREIKVPVSLEVYDATKGGTSQHEGYLVYPAYSQQYSQLNQRAMMIRLKSVGHNICQGNLVWNGKNVGYNTSCFNGQVTHTERARRPRDFVIVDGAYFPKIEIHPKDGESFIRVIYLKSG